MNETFESELRAAFTERADALSPEREARLRALDYSRPSHSLRRRFRSLAWPTKVGVAVGAVGILGGAAFAATQLGTGAESYQLTGFACQLDNGTVDNIEAVTGSPIEDCSVAWPQFAHGQRAPRLIVWGREDGYRATAIVAPASDRDPLGKVPKGWTKLSSSWHTNLKLTVLNDQLSNITLSLNTEGAYSGGGNGAPNACSYAPADVKAVRGLLTADGLRGWRVVVTALPVGHSTYTHSCHSTYPEIRATSREVQLIQSPAIRPTSAAVPASGNPAPVSGSVTAPASLAPPPTRRRQSKAAALTAQARRQRIADESLSIDTAAYAQLRIVYDHVNAQLQNRCESVSSATKLWTAQAQAAGFSQAMPSFWRSGSLRPSRQNFHHYVLYRQPAGQHTGNCAHVLVMGIPGYGIADVYVARITP